MAMTTLQSAQLDALIKSATKYTEENPAIVGAAVATTTLLTSILFLRRREMKRDGNDYESQLTGGLKILNNADHTLKVFVFPGTINSKSLKVFVDREKSSILPFRNMKVYLVVLEVPLELSPRKSPLRLCNLPSGMVFIIIDNNAFVRAVKSNTLVWSTIFIIWLLISMNGDGAKAFISLPVSTTRRSSSRSKEPSITWPADSASSQDTRC